MDADRFTTTEQDVAGGGVRLFLSAEDVINADRDATLQMAKANGFDTVQEEPESYLCGKHSTAELVEVFLDGTWEYRDSTEDEVKTQSGTDALMLGCFLKDKDAYRAAINA